MRCAPRASHGPTHLGLSALSAAAPGWRVPAIRVVSHSTFQHIILTAIISNCIWMAVTAEVPCEEADCEDDSLTFKVIEVVFLVIYTVEVRHPGLKLNIPP